MVLRGHVCITVLCYLADKLPGMAPQLRAFYFQPRFLTTRRWFTRVNIDQLARPDTYSASERTHFHISPSKILSLRFELDAILVNFLT